MGAPLLERKLPAEMEKLRIGKARIHSNNLELAIDKIV